jgi:2-polyprenyl-3-methyl-5-hydroxy-6-metoxy-1,4-benzoquinol methylase
LACPPPDLLAQGHYARKQLFSRSRIVAWSHRRRFEVARELAGARGGALLDYGCGDGTFIALAHERFTSATGTDADAAQLADCAQRLGHLAGVHFVSLSQLGGADHAGRYTAVTCMEVLEHCPADVQHAVLADLDRVMAADARLVISVPIEIGPALAVKQGVRRFAAAAGLSEYAGRERYRVGEFARMIVAGPTTSIEREITTARASDGTLLRFHGHKGFNWRALERLVRARFTIERRLYSPLPLAGCWLNSQVWFVCRKRSR